MRFLRMSRLFFPSPFEVAIPLVAGVSGWISGWFMWGATAQSLPISSHCSLSFCMTCNRSMSYSEGLLLLVTWYEFILEILVSHLFLFLEGQMAHIDLSTNTDETVAIDNCPHCARLRALCWRLSPIMPRMNHRSDPWIGWNWRRSSGSLGGLLHRG